MKINVGEVIKDSEFKKIDPVELADKSRLNARDAKVRSNARRAFDELLNSKETQLQKVTVEGIDFYIKKLSYTDFVEHTLNIMREADGVLNLAESSNATGKHVLLSCVCESDGTPFFTHDDADKYFNDYRLTELINELLLHVYNANPCLLNSLKKT